MPGRNVMNELCNAYKGFERSVKTMPQSCVSNVDYLGLRNDFPFNIHYTCPSICTIFNPALINVAITRGTMICQYLMT